MLTLTLNLALVLTLTLALTLALTIALPLNRCAVHFDGATGRIASATVTLPLAP